MPDADRLTAATPVGREAVFLQKVAHQFQRGMLVSLGFDQHIENFALGVNGSPSIGPCGQRFSDRLRPDAKLRRVLGRRLRKSAAMIGPKRFTQRRTVSYETAIPRSANKSSTSRKLSVKRR